MAKKKRKYIKGVWLNNRPDLWAKLPINIKKIIIAGTEEIRKIRENIECRAKFKQMPLIQVLIVNWAYPGGDVYWGHNTISKAGKIVAQIPASTLLVTKNNSQLLRGILIHEFSHCFWTSFFLVKHSEMGNVDFSSPDIPQLDSERHVNLKDWFASEDADAFIKEGDPRTKALLNEDSAMMLSRSGLKQQLPKPGKDCSVELTDDIICFINKLHKNNRVPHLGRKA